MRLIIVSILLTIILGLLVMIIGCEDNSVSITGSERVEITIIEEEGDGDLDVGCCDGEEERDYSRCWSTCQSKNLLDPDECAACQRGDRDCVWPWEVDIECLQE